MALVVLPPTFVGYMLFLQGTCEAIAVLLGGVRALLKFISVVGPLAAILVLIILVEVLGGYQSRHRANLFILCYHLSGLCLVALPYGYHRASTRSPTFLAFRRRARSRAPGLFFSVRWSDIARRVCRTMRAIPAGTFEGSATTA